MGLITITQPASEPVTLTEMKTWVRLDDGPDATANAVNDALLSSLIASARIECENILGRALLEQTLELVLPCFPRTVIRGIYCPDTSDGSKISLQRPPLVSLTSITYYDADNVQVVMDEDDYVAVSTSDDTQAVVYHVPDGDWPATYDRLDAVRVRYVAGWEGAEDVPEPIKTWIKLRAADLWANREPTVVGNTATSAVRIPDRYMDALLDRWRIRLVA